MANKTIMVRSKAIGEDEKLGELLMANFLRNMVDSEEKPKTIVFLNTGVYLLCEGSKVLDSISALESSGVGILACTTCIEYLNLMGKLKAGKTTTMHDTVKLIMSTETVCI